jgi:hypothetical protein
MKLPSRISSVNAMLELDHDRSSYELHIDFRDYRYIRIGKLVVREEPISHEFIGSIDRRSSNRVNTA